MRASGYACTRSGGSVDEEVHVQRTEDCIRQTAAATGIVGPAIRAGRPATRSVRPAPTAGMLAVETSSTERARMIRRAQDRQEEKANFNALSASVRRDDCKMVAPSIGPLVLERRQYRQRRFDPVAKIQRTFHDEIAFRAILASGQRADIPL